MLQIELQLKIPCARFACAQTLSAYCVENTPSAKDCRNKFDQPCMFFVWLGKDLSGFTFGFAPLPKGCNLQILRCGAAVYALETYQGSLWRK